MENHATRPEVRAALAGAVGGATRFSRTLLRDMMYVAVPVVEEGRITGVVRAAMAVDAIGATLDELYLRVALGGLAAVVIIALVSLWLSRRISRPLEEMTRGAARFAQGDLAQRLALRGSREIDALALAMNQMAAQLDDRIRAVENQRNEQEAMLASMVEGMLAVDTEERILRINRSAETLLGIRSGQVLGRRLQEVVRKADLQRFVARTLASRQPVEADLVLHDQQERFLQAHGTLLRGSDGKDLGALIVLNDVTRLRRLENLRRDFVANVSHELKTPITAIKGCVETLLDGAAADPDGFPPLPGNHRPPGRTAERHHRRSVDPVAHRAGRGKSGHPAAGRGPVRRPGGGHPVLFGDRRGAFDPPRPRLSRGGHGGDQSAAARAGAGQPHRQRGQVQ